MFPVLIPQVLRIEGPYNKGRYDDTMYVSNLLRN